MSRLVASAKVSPNSPIGGALLDRTLDVAFAIFFAAYLVASLGGWE